MRRLAPMMIPLLTIPVLVFFCGIPSHHQAYAEDTKKKVEFSASELEQFAGKLDLILQELEAASRKIPRDTFDPRTIVQQVGSDPIKLFEWVRDNTYWIPYEGSLRGPVGVLMDRLGNSLDRSLLLADLLNSNGHKVRLAQAILSEDEAKKILPKIRPVPRDPLPPPKVVVDLEASLEQVAKRLQIDAQELQKDMELLSLMNTQDSDNALKQISEQRAMLLNAIGKLGFQGKPSTGHEIQALRKHWWAQYQVDGKWIDLDPITPDMKPGRSLAKPERTLKPEDLSEDLFHLIDIRILIEKWDDGVLKEHLVLKHRLRPAELLAERIMFSHHPMISAEDLDLSEEMDSSQRLSTLALKQEEWLPILLVGADIISQFGFTDKGKVNENPNLEPVKKLGGSVGGLFGGAFGGGNTKKKTEEDSLLTAEWIEYEIRIPGQDARKIRREIFDLIGPASRASGSIPKPDISDARRLERGYSILGTIDILPLVCQVSQQFMDWQIAQRVLTDVPPLTRGVNNGTFTNPSDLQTTVLTAMELAQGPLYAWALARQELNQDNKDLYLASVNIVNFRKRLAEDAQGNLIWRRTFDIVNNDVAVHCKPDVEAAIVRMNQGVADTVAEGIVFAEPELQESANQLFALSAGQGIKWRLVRTACDASWTRQSLFADVYVRLEGDLSGGYAVVIPDKPVEMAGSKRLGWWRVNLTNGETLGVMDTGLHQAKAEKILLEVNSMRQQLVCNAVFTNPQSVGSLNYLGFLRYMGFGRANPYAKGLYVELLKALAGL